MQTAPKRCSTSSAAQMLAFREASTFCQSSHHILANPGFIAEKQNSQVWETGPRSEYVSPESGQQAAQRREVAAGAQKLYLYPFETEPFWKFGFLENVQAGHQFIVDSGKFQRTWIAKACEMRTLFLSAGRIPRKKYSVSFARSMGRWCRAVDAMASCIHTSAVTSANGRKRAS